MEGRCKMVIVEDDALSLELLASLIERKFKEIDVFTAGNGREGLDVCNSEVPDMLLTDIKMPEMDGVQLAQIVRENHPETIIIMISADSGETSLRRPGNSDLEIDYFIRKPVDYKKLFSAIEESISRRS